MDNMNQFARIGVLAAAMVAALAGCNRDEGQTQAPAPQPQVDAEAAPATGPAYAMSTCVVSGEELGSMGKPIIVQVEGRDVQLCCEGCVDTLKADPKKYLAKLDAAAKNPTTRPATE